MHVPVSHRWAILLLALASFLTLADSAAWAQSSCETALQAAEKSYELGLFEDVPGQLEPCLEGQSSRAEIVRAQSLLARSYIEMDQPDEAREAAAELLRIDPSYEPGPPPRFAALVEEIRRREADLQVATVSKTNESLREAPATVVVISAEEIEQRGYLDLEQVLHDLPGFDITRGNGETYSNFYQRGFRSKDNDRILLLVDGVEQNDIATGVAHLSRQYPVSAVDRIEVVYGPASTIYGANAYSGVINIITKPPEAFLSPGKRFGALVQAGGGAFGTRYTDLSLAGQDRSGSVAWSVTGRLYRSDEMDLSRFPGWRYDFAAVPYKDLLRLEDGAAQAFCGFQSFYCGEDLAGNLIAADYDENGNAQAVYLTEAGERRVRELDQAVGMKGFSDRTEDWSLYAKLRLTNLTLGLSAWGLEEGATPWYAGSGSAERAPASWAPEHRSLFVKYARSLGKDLSLNLFTRYRQSDLDPRRSQRNELFTYANGALSLESIRSGCGVGFPPTLQLPCESTLQSVDAPRRLASQAAAELSLVYAPRRQFTLVSGLDLKKGTIQTREAEFRFGVGSVDQVVDHTDLGLYAQASYKPFSKLSLIAGGRVDYNESSSPEFPDAGFGTLFSPRLAVVYLPGRYAVKLIYSEAFKDPSDFEKFSEELNVSLPNPQLRPERTRNLEISTGWYQDDKTSLELSVYQARYKDIVAVGQVCLPGIIVSGQPFSPVPCVPFGENIVFYDQLQNILDMEVRGVELRAGTHVREILLVGNLTYTDPSGTEPPSEESEIGPRPRVRIADIASFRANLGIDLPFGEKISMYLRWSHVGSRRTGEGTTVPTNPLRSIGSYSVANATLTYKDVLPGASIQFIVNNLLDEDYEDPGVLTADGIDLAASIPQPGRAFYARITWGLGAGNSARSSSHAPLGSPDLLK